MTTTAARVCRATKVYGTGAVAVTALDGVDLELERATFTAVMGPSGSGKSTFLHCLAGLDRVTDGEVWIGDTELGALRERALTALRRDRIGFVFQAYNLLPALTAAANITLALDIAGRRPEPDWWDTVVDAVGLHDRLDHRPSQLSGGQQQRVAVARALVGRPDIVFADEPTGNLDSQAGAQLLDLLRRSVREFGQTIVMVTHDPVAASYADRAVFLADGRIVDTEDEPTPQNVLDRMKALGVDHHATSEPTKPAVTQGAADTDGPGGRPRRRLHVRHLHVHRDAAVQSGRAVPHRHRADRRHRPARHAHH